MNREEKKVRKYKYRQVDRLQGGNRHGETVRKEGKKQNMNPSQEEIRGEYL